MKLKALVSWIGQNDLNATIDQQKNRGPGAIASAVTKWDFDKVFLLSNYRDEKNQPYLNWFKEEFSVDLVYKHVSLSGPTEYDEIYLAVVDLFEQEKIEENYSLTFNVSSGTPAMSTIWIIVALSRFTDVRLIESSPYREPEEINFPFNLKAEFISASTSREEQDITFLLAGLPDEVPKSFQEIICESKALRDPIARARWLSKFENPVLILGETGTGKGMFARAIHASSKRSKNTFVEFNCSSIPDDLFASELFGYEKGAFTGATKTKDGKLVLAHEGTIFLDEIGDLSLNNQVVLLKAIEEKKFYRIGGDSIMNPDFRLIAATNKNLFEEVKKGNFREDLFYRIASTTIRIPPLRNRESDTLLLAEHFLQKLNEKYRDEEGYYQRIFSDDAVEFMRMYDWPGNVRELRNSIEHAALLATGEIDEELWTQYIEKKDIKESIFTISPSDPGSSILESTIGGDFTIYDLVGKLVQHYYNRAYEESNRVKSVASELLGFSNRQTMDNWYEKYVAKRNLGPGKESFDWSK